MTGRKSIPPAAVPGKPRTVAPMQPIPATPPKKSVPPPARRPR